MRRLSSLLQKAPVLMPEGVGCSCLRGQGSCSEASAHKAAEQPDVIDTCMLCFLLATHDVVVSASMDSVVPHWQCDTALHSAAGYLLLRLGVAVPELQMMTQPALPPLMHFIDTAGRDALTGAWDSIQAAC